MDMTEDNNYKNYSVEDFVWDEKFREWVLTSTPELTLFWTEFLIGHPEHEENTAAAKEIILRLKVKELVIGNFEHASILQAVHKSIDAPETPVVKRKGNKRLFFKIAAVLLVFLTIAFGFWSLFPVKEDYGNSYEALVETS